MKAIFIRLIIGLWGRSGEPPNSNSFCGVVNGHGSSHNISRQVHEGSRFSFFVDFLFLLRLVEFGMTRVDQMFKRGAYKRNNREGKSHLGVFQGAFTRGYINGSTDGRTNLGQGGHGGLKAREGGGRQPLDDR